MGMYTEFCVGVALKEDVPQEVIDVLAVMVEGNLDSARPEIDHPFFDTERWSWMLKSGGSYYFDQSPVLVWRFDAISKNWRLTCWTNIKNYTDEIEQFFDWLAPYVGEDNGPYFMGFQRYEEDAAPTLIYSVNGTVKYVSTEAPNESQ